MPTKTTREAPKKSQVRSKALAAAKPAPKAKSRPATKPAAKSKSKTESKIKTQPPASRSSTTKPQPQPRPKTTATKAKPKSVVKSEPSKASTRPPGTRKKTSRTAKPKGLEASYSGKIFRSRLEARWAVLLDLLDINWDYEPSHYQIGPELYYLPDFYLPDLQLWLEVKGPVFMDAQSTAKCLAAVAGPMPLPLREAPYTAADQLLIAGPLHAIAGTTAQHTLVTKRSAGKASLSYATMTRAGVSAISEPWDVAPADGKAKARRPLPERVSALVDPAARPGVFDSEAAAAYRVASKLGFDDGSKSLSRSTSPQILHQLSRRRAGRPLGPFPSA